MFDGDFLEGEEKKKKPLKATAGHCLLYIHIAVGQVSGFGFSFFLSSTSPALIFSSSEGRRVIRSASKNLTPRKPSGRDERGDKSQ